MKYGFVLEILNFKDSQKSWKFGKGIWIEGTTYYTRLVVFKVTLLVQSKYFSKNHISKTTAAIGLILVPIFR